MRKLFLTSVTLSVVGFSAASWADVQDFTVINKTGMIIDALYVSESDKNTWEEDVLGQDTLKNGESVPVKFSGYGDEVCLFNIKIVDTEETGWIVENIDLCKTHKLTFKKKGGKVTYVAE